MDTRLFCFFAKFILLFEMRLAKKRIEGESLITAKGNSIVGMKGNRRVNFEKN